MADNIFQGLSDTLNNVAASQGNQWAQGRVQDAAVRDGMNQLGGLLEKNNNDPSRAMLDFVQSPEGHKIMAVPGAYKSLTEQFQKALIRPSPVSTPAGPGSVVTQQGQPYPLQGNPGYTPPSPEAINTQPGGNTQVYQNGPGGARNVQQINQPTSESQHTDYIMKNFGQGLTQEGLSQLALSTLASTPYSQSILGIGNLVKSKQLTPEEGRVALSGQYSILQDKEVPGRFYIQDRIHPENIKMLQLGGFGQSGQNGQGNGTLVPNWTTGPNSNPASISSTPQREGGNSTQSGMGQGQSGPITVSPQAKSTAQKYNVPIESIQKDGTINPVAAWGRGVLPILGAGLPAIIQNRAGIVSRWADPSNKDAVTDTVKEAEIAGDSLQYLLGGLGQKNSRIKVLIDSILEMGPEHEKWNDPQYATDQLIQLRSTLEGQANVNAEQIKGLKMEGLKADNSLMADYSAQNTAIEKVLRFLPSTEGLQSMKQAIQDGKVKVPSLASAGSTIGRVTGQVLQSGANVLFGNGNADTWNNDTPGTVSKIQSANSSRQLESIAREYTRLNPAIQRALDAKLDALRSAGKPMQYAPKGAPKKQGPSVKQFLQNPSQEQTVKLRSGKEAILPPANGQESPTYEGTSPFGNTAINKRIGSAFSQFGM